MSITAPVIRYHGGKFRLATWVLDHFPPHKCYVEPFGGAAGVLIENRPAIEVLRAHDASETLHYVDPPYMHDTRVNGAAKGRYYRHELSDEQHAELLAILKTLSGFVVLSGYPSELYRAELKGWTMNTTSARISAGRGGSTRMECLWINPACMDALHQRGLALEGVA